MVHKDVFLQARTKYHVKGLLHNFHVITYLHFFCQILQVRGTHFSLDAPPEVPFFTGKKTAGGKSGGSTEPAQQSRVCISS